MKGAGSGYQAYSVCNRVVDLIKRCNRLELSFTLFIIDSKKKRK